jgi:hypothetical protein
VSFIRQFFFEIQNQGIFNMTVFDGGTFVVMLTLAFGVPNKKNLVFGILKASRFST